MIFRNALAAGVLLLAIPTAASAKPMERFCAHDKIYANGDEGSPLGTVETEAVLRYVGTAPRVSYYNRMPDSVQELRFADIPATQDRSGVLHFVFRDNWNNRGPGKFAVYGAKAKISFGDVKSANNEGSNAARGYGDTDLSAADCRRMKSHFR